MRRLLAGLALAGAVWGAAPANAQDSPLTGLVDAAAERLTTAEAVAANKWNTKGPIEDPARVEQVLAAVAADAEARGVDPDRVRRVFRDQISATEAIEYTRFAQWKLDPAVAPTTAPELASSRAVIDGLNRTMVEQMAAQWPLLQSPTCTDRVREAADAVAARRALDPLYRQALAFVTRSYCG
ncbi:chorismate mutase [Mycobacterium sp. GA-2829]|uniref:chorismate mutase n=1 Tax=Mycobacterium sp. GA-2829 TaxID=1772283 RepID=UPI00073FD948|nr:chorismate mutase [Mycobacterium sp. GA-2829]KUI35052.1 chorismate mutase [Mycobacterium sp. GA-2829]